MVDIQKKPIKLRDRVYKDARSARREADQSRRARETTDEARRIDRLLRRPSKQTTYAKEMALFDKVKEGYHGEIGYKFLGNKKLAIENNDERTRKRGVVRRTTEVLKRAPQSDTVYISQLEREDWRKTAHYSFDANGELRSRSLKLKDGSLREKWERDENGHLLRTSYYTDRFRDGRFFRAISEEISAPYVSQADNKKYRTLTRTKGSRKEVFERDENGSLTLIGREIRGFFSKHSIKSQDRRTEVTETKTLFGVKSYTSLLDPQGNELGRNITSHRRLWNKRSAVFDKTSHQLTEAKHTFGKLFKRETKYVGNDAKIVTTTVLGIKLKTRLKGLQEHERNAQIMRAAEASEHKAAWDNTYPFESPSNERDNIARGATHQQPNDSSHFEPTRVDGHGPANSISPTNINKIMLAAAQRQSTVAPQIARETRQDDFSRAQPPKVLTAASHGDGGTKLGGSDTSEILRTSDVGNRNDAINEDFGKTQLPKLQGELKSGAGLNGREYPWGMPPWTATNHGDGATKPGVSETASETLPTSDVANRNDAIKDNFSKAQPSSYRSTSVVNATPNDRRMALLEATRRRDEATKRAGLDPRIVEGVGRC